MPVTRRPCLIDALLTRKKVNPKFSRFPSNAIKVPALLLCIRMFTKKHTCLMTLGHVPLFCKQLPVWEAAAVARNLHAKTDATNARWRHQYRKLAVLAQKKSPSFLNTISNKVGNDSESYSPTTAFQPLPKFCWKIAFQSPVHSPRRF